MNRSIVVLAAVTLLSGCDALGSESVIPLSCNVLRADGGPAADVNVSCTGSDDAGTVTSETGAFTINVLVFQGGIAGWTDKCGPIAFEQGGRSLDARWNGTDGGITAQKLDTPGQRRCGITVE